MTTTTPTLAVASAATSTSPARPRKRGRGARISYIVRLLAAIAVSIVLLFPLYWMIVVAFSSKQELLSRDLRLWPREFTIANFTTVFDTFPTVTWFGNSVVIAVFVTALTVLVNLLAGYAFARLRFRGSNLLFLLALSTLMLPVQVIMVSQFKLVTELGIYGTYWAVILPTAATAFGIFLARQFIIGIPEEIIEAARVDGAGHFRVFAQIVLPLCKPLIAVLILLTFLSTWNDFAWPLIALKQSELYTLPIGLLFLKGQYGTDYGAIMALALVSVLPMIIVFLVFQRYFVQGFARSGIK
ncbi:carbohydrate ABC transporter permease [Planctomonas psychrotolerans]|uniref:carbohydrate ABC transporter permease n=1 Tax=Planctomonas psychrotolerans TaxID=2528712 RepID=UPI0012392AD4|nr:carbohydrate ABC transporter permease [Planctomonas psychrotolerans]